MAAGRTDEPAKAKKAAGARGRMRPTYTHLPIVVHALPPLIPHNPLSVLYVAYVCLKQLFFPPSSFPASPYTGTFSADTCSVHVTDKASIDAFWQNGFFGKGNLSRSEPTWLDREKRRLGIAAGETAEELTARRRAERKAFKQQRAKTQREEIEAQHKAGDAQSGAAGGVAQISHETVQEDSAPLLRSAMPIDNNQEQTNSAYIATQQQPKPQHTLPQTITPSEEQPEVTNEEHLQLELTEAFFLSYALGVLQVWTTSAGEPMSTSNLFKACLAHATFPPTCTDLEADPPSPDNQFLISYVAYHHFRSLGWVVRSGVKFGVDILLYNRGPVFSHAEFAVYLVPSYSHSYWKSEEGFLFMKKKKVARPWHWLHMINRVQAHVRKTLVICFVEVPPPFDGDIFRDLDIGSILKSYKVREMAIKRWVPNRSRD